MMKQIQDGPTQVWEGGRTRGDNSAIVVEFADMGAECGLDFIACSSCCRAVAKLKGMDF